MHLFCPGLKQDNSQSSDLTEADALGFKEGSVHVYSNSWGPLDWGFYVDGPGPLVERTFETATREVHSTGFNSDIHEYTGT